jgi:carbonic anhydrase/acetyltransferase-like protein (isoleucine patch superfamily)
MALYELDGTQVTVPANGRYWVAESASVIGQVTLEEDVSIWFGSVLRGDNEPITIGARSNIQDGVVLHTDPGFPCVVGEACTIGHMAMLHGCTIGRGSLIGIGAVVLNGARIGEECLIGAKALVPEGKTIPPRSVVLGAPGKIVRQVTEKDLELIRWGVGVYLSKWPRYARTLRRQSEDRRDGA